ncbi:SAM-dependent methyltransferase [Herbidospora daliensis]|uniref:SAM-dependent methyltransferase n=1 Tax=Herbidospora daliensis TaxID=295585 RepID=UPI0007822ECB|nr:SAM-dependent methyltransferase [Herbidospora daliensis]
MEKPDGDRAPSLAHVYLHLVGSERERPQDRRAADEVAAAAPALVDLARQSTRFLMEAVAYCARQGVDQFLDIGSGTPGSPPVHEAAHAVNPAARIVYVDSDPGAPSRVPPRHFDATRRVWQIKAAAGDTEGILSHGTVIRVLDLTRPVAVLWTSTMSLIPDHDDPVGIARAMMEEMPSGSHMVMSHVTSDGADPEMLAYVHRRNPLFHRPLQLRRRHQIVSFFDGLDLVGPGLVPVTDWPAPADPPVVLPLSGYAAVGRKP